MSLAALRTWHGCCCLLTVLFAMFGATALPFGALYEQFFLLLTLHSPVFLLPCPLPCPILCNAGGAAGHRPCIRCAPDGGGGAVRRAAAAGRHLPGALMLGRSLLMCSWMACVQGSDSTAARAYLDHHAHGFHPLCRPQRCGAVSPRQTCWASPAASLVGCRVGVWG